MPNTDKVSKTVYLCKLLHKSSVLRNFCRQWHSHCYFFKIDANSLAAVNGVF